MALILPAEFDAQYGVTISILLSHASTLKCHFVIKKKCNDLMPYDEEKNERPLPAALRALVVAEVLPGTPGLAQQGLRGLEGVGARVEVQVGHAGLRGAFLFGAGTAAVVGHVELAVHAPHQRLVLVYEQFYPISANKYVRLG